MGTSMTGRNPDARSLGIGNPSTFEVNFQRTLQDVTNMAPLAPMRFHEVGSELHQPNLFVALAMGLETCAGKKTLPG